MGFRSGPIQAHLGTHQNDLAPTFHVVGADGGIHAARGATDCASLCASKDIGARAIYLALSPSAVRGVTGLAVYESDLFVCERLEAFAGRASRTRFHAIVDALPLDEPLRANCARAEELALQGRLHEDLPTASTGAPVLRLLDLPRAPSRGQAAPQVSARAPALDVSYLINAKALVARLDRFASALATRGDFSAYAPYAGIPLGGFSLLHERATRKGSVARLKAFERMVQGFDPHALACVPDPRALFAFPLRDWERHPAIAHAPVHVRGAACERIALARAHYETEFAALLDVEGAGFPAQDNAAPIDRAFAAVCAWARDTALAALMAANHAQSLVEDCIPPHKVTPGPARPLRTHFL